MLAPAVRGADPRAFAMVMATGIVSVALRQAGSPPLSAALLWVASAAFVVLVIGIAPGTVMAHLSRAVAALRRDLPMASKDTNATEVTR